MARASHNVSTHWRTHEGRVLPFGEMATVHLFYSIRMLFNNAPEVSPADRLLAGKKWKVNLSRSQCKDAVRALFTELLGREDMPIILLPQLEKMERIGGPLLRNLYK